MVALASVFLEKVIDPSASVSILIPLLVACAFLPSGILTVSGKSLASTECWLIGIINKHIPAKKLVNIVYC